jgi:hypothetical protein
MKISSEKQGYDFLEMSKETVSRFALSINPRNRESQAGAIAFFAYLLKDRECISSTLWKILIFCRYAQSLKTSAGWVR